jgi:thymidine kinase
LKDIDYLIKQYDLIIVDEGQFFPDLKEYVLKWVDIDKKEITVGGLDGGHKRNKLGEILDLIPFSDTCIKISSLCKKCNDGTPGIFTLRTNSNEEQVQIGGEESYMPMCRKHYLGI